ncbi:RNA polymerase sigma factor [Paenibacillus faecalis]|uniref:RNA polymerase sigma factor n=1 Tax=Paenibacillus faecalis TaxID=2079532 RepID=UPI000D108200|nr:RNA polymerase sigma factor [Paenibacillus faecalis]
MTDLQHIYDKYFHEVYLFVLSLSRDEHIAEEITQETFFKALKSIHSFNGSSKLSVWLCQIAKNTYFSYLDKQKRYTPHHSYDQASDQDIEKQVINKTEAFRIHKLVHELQEPYKEIFMLRVFGELSFYQISQIFGKTESWARVTFHRAKQKVQNLYREDEL